MQSAQRRANVLGGKNAGSYAVVRLNIQKMGGCLVGVYAGIYNGVFFLSEFSNFFFF